MNVRRQVITRRLETVTLASKWADPDWCISDNLYDKGHAVIFSVRPSAEYELLMQNSWFIRSLLQQKRKRLRINLFKWQVTPFIIHQLTYCIAVVSCDFFHNFSVSEFQFRKKTCQFQHSGNCSPCLWSRCLSCQKGKFWYTNMNVKKSLLPVFIY